MLLYGKYYWCVYLVYKKYLVQVVVNWNKYIYHFFFYSNCLWPGLYFARDASYSARGTYSRPDTDGNKYIYLVRVLTGEYTVGNSSMKVPPAKDPSKDPNILFDSTVDNTTDPQIFVVFFDWQAYPEYLIVFN